MKKIIMLICLLTLVSGCTVVRIDTTDIDNTISIILSKENKLYNHVGKGYKYYVPRGVTYIDTDEFNDKLYSDGDYYYLYIDAVSYYHQMPIVYDENKDAYYSKKINVDGKDGYVEITKTENNKYLINFVYNYARIESIVDKDKINNVILNCSYILSTIKFNHNVVKLMLDEDYLTNTEEKYNKFEPRKNISNHIDFEDENVEEEEENSEEGNFEEENSEETNIEDNESIEVE